MVYRIYYINKWRLWIAVIPTHHAYFTEWMAQNKKLLKVIPQISIRFLPTDHNVSRQEDQDRMRFPTMCKLLYIRSGHIATFTAVSSFYWISSEIFFRLTDVCLQCLSRLDAFYERAREETRAWIGNAPERPIRELKCSVHGAQLVEGKNCSWKRYYQLFYFGFPFKMAWAPAKENRLEYVDSRFTNALWKLTVLY